MTYGFNASDVSNLTSLCGSVHDIELDRTYRLLIIYLTISLCVVGSILVVLWMLCNRRMSSNVNQLSRVNVFILYLTIADILVILLAVLPQLIWEYADRDWRAGDVMCRLVKFLQRFSMMASNYMVVVIAVDRHQAICALELVFSAYVSALKIVMHHCVIIIVCFCGIVNSLLFLVWKSRAYML